MDPAPFPEGLARLVEGELEPDERIVWQARPMRGRFALRIWPLVAFGAFWTAGCIYGLVSTLRMSSGAGGGPDPFLLFEMPFLLIGIAMLCSPLWMLFKARRTAYVITERRAILFDGGLSTTIRTFDPPQLDNLEFRRRRDGTGDIILGRKTLRDVDGDVQSWPFGFFCIPDVKETEKLLRDVAAARREQPAGNGP